MAKRVEVILEDDREGGPAAQTVAFGLDGLDYEIDLSDQNAEALRAALAPWVAAGRKLGRRRRSNQSVRNNGSADTNKAIRAWAAEQGIEVADRGRIPQKLRDQYARARVALPRW